jgi:phage terminase small subunit
MPSEVGDHVMVKGKLTEKQKRFADYYVELGNATEAAIKAGYSKKTARQVGSENLSKPYILAYIEEQIAKKDTERVASQDEVLEFLTTVMRGQITEQVPVVMEKTFEMVDKTPTIKDRTKAAELLGKRYQLFTDKVNMDGDMSININVRGSKDGG